MPDYRFLEHRTDAKIEAYGNDLETAFENAAKALEDTMVDIASIGDKNKEEIRVEGRDLQSLLYSWLESLITKEEIEGMLYSRFSCKISKTGKGYELHALARGEKFQSSKHEPKTAIKAPTYHDMKIEETPEQVTVRFLLDL